MKLNSIYLLFLFLFFRIITASGNNATLDSANTAYAKANYSKAIKLYESLLSTGQEASAVYFNLGNSYYKSNSIGNAILNYERAKKLAPDDEDITINLKLANQKTEDKIEAAPQLFLTTWKNGLVDMMGEKSWAKLCILLFAVSLFLFGVYLFTTRYVLKQIGFFGGCFLILTSSFVFFIARHKYQTTKTSDTAIITMAAVTVTGSPSEKGTKLFILHEGTKVNVLSKDGNYTEVKIANGNVGWLPNHSMMMI